jgi:hypothetical protein
VSEAKEIPSAPEEEAPEANPADSPPPPPEPPTPPPKNPGEDEPEHHVVTPEDLEGLRGAAQYVDRTPRATIDLLMEGPPDDSPPADDLSYLSPEDNESLHDLTAPEETLRFHHKLETNQYHAALDATGTELSKSAYFPGIQIKDGEKFATALAAMPEEDDELRYVAEQVIDTTLTNVVERYIPPHQDKRYPKSLSQPALLPEATEATPQADSQRAQAAQAVLHAPSLASELERLGAEPHLVTQLNNIRIADGEGMLPHWAVAHHWGLFDPPASEHEWTRWVQPFEWQNFHGFIDNLVEVAPPQSKFAKNLVSATLSNVTHLINDKLESLGTTDPDTRMTPPNLPPELSRLIQPSVAHSSSAKMYVDEIIHRVQLKKAQTKLQQALDSLD